MIQSRQPQSYVVRHQRVAALSRRVAVNSANDNGAPATSATEQATTSGATKELDLEKDVNKIVRQTAATFAPRSSTATKNPAVKGSLLYNVFEWQAWICLAVGGLLSFNVIFPTDDPSIPRLMGMWSIWMFTVPSLRAKECTAKEKDALNLLFVAIPLINVLLPFVWKSFPFIFTADVMAVLGVYYWKGVWKEVYGLPLEPPAAAAGPADGNGSA